MPTSGGKCEKAPMRLARRKGLLLDEAGLLCRQASFDGFTRGDSMVCWGCVDGGEDAIGFSLLIWPTKHDSGILKIFRGVDVEAATNLRIDRMLIVDWLILTTWGWWGRREKRGFTELGRAVSARQGRRRGEVDITLKCQMDDGHSMKASGQRKGHPPLR